MKKFFNQSKSVLKKSLSNQSGMTLLELLVVIVIMGVLAGISFQAFSGQGEDARVKAHQANLESVQSAAERYDLTVGFVNAEYTIIADTHPLITKGYLKDLVKNPWADTTQDFAAFKYAVTKDDRGIFYAYLVDAQTPTKYVALDVDGQAVSKAPAAGAGNVKFVTPAAGTVNAEDRIIN